MPSKLLRLLTVKHVLLSLLTVLVARKIFIGKLAMDYVQTCKSEVDFEALISSSSFAYTVKNFSETEPSLIVIQNQHALNMTFNWLCNTADMKGVHERTVIVTLDKASERSLKKHWPGIRTLHWPVSCLADAFNYGDGRYQLFYLFRSNLARAFLHFGKPFWMIQQDTFWRDNLLELNLESRKTESDLVFDRATESGGEIIAGGYYFVRPTCAAKAFFRKLSSDLEEFYTPDNAYMTTLCADRGIATCGSIPFHIITNWIWLHEPSRVSDAAKIPYLIQFDGDTKLGGKLGKMRSLGFYFVKSDGHTCNADAVRKATKLLSDKETRLNTASIKSYSHLQFGLYQWFIDQFYKSTVTKKFMEAIVFPYAHYFMITL
uniref:Nucleotid_trans domain-containing protein n=1 Tax=Panagrellus redivivus TaxID=6233 RepID=A0A7E4VQ08_PANRE